MSPRSRRPSAEVQAARKASSIERLTERIEDRQERVREAVEAVLAARICRCREDVIRLEDALRDALANVEILKDMTAKREAI